MLRLVAGAPLPENEASPVEFYNGAGAFGTEDDASQHYRRGSIQELLDVEKPDFVRVSIRKGGEEAVRACVGHRVR